MFYLPFHSSLQYEHGDEESQKNVDNLMPKKVKKRKKITTEDGVCCSAAVKPQRDNPIFCFTCTAYQPIIFLLLLRNGMHNL